MENPVFATQEPTESLARSAFGFALLGSITAIITWIALLLSPPSPLPLFEQIRIAIISGFGVITLSMIAVTIWLLRVDLDWLAKKMYPLERLLRRRWLSIFLLILLLEINVLAFPLLYNVAPSITNPAKFLLVTWSLICLGIILTANLAELTLWLQHTQNFWTATGITVCLLALVGSFVRLNNELVHQSGVNDILRGSLDYRDVQFIDDGEAITASAFFTEQGSVRVRWSPYTYWVSDVFEGEYINIDPNGLRHTPQTVSESAPWIGFFGGSTMWGEGARDRYTIPGHIAQLLAAENIEAYTVNFGQTGYVSTQDLLLFQQQIVAGSEPEIAIFYQGFNDILAAWGEGYTGVTLQEHRRIGVYEAGRRLADGQLVFGLPNISLAQYDLTLAGATVASPEAVVERWLANKRLIRTIATEYDIRVLFVWQPSIIFKSPLTPSEQAIYDRWNAERPGLFELYREVDAIVRNTVNRTEDLYLLSDLFAGDEQTVFLDGVHITEVGNGLVAEAILPRLLPLLDNSPQ